ncbi:MAG: hypothetical protein KAH24_06600 [Holophagae bacterium]|nr:hypothetical protein [Holophagae bacterium]
MKRLFVFLVMFMIVPAFGAYKLVLKNGAVLELAQKPDLSGKQVTAETMKGKRIIFPVRYVNFVATKLANQKKPAPVKAVASPVQKAVATTDRKAVPGRLGKTGEPKVPLVITNETVKKTAVEEGTAEETAAKAAEALQEKKDRFARAAAVEEEEEPVGVTDDKGRGEEHWRGEFQKNRVLQAGVLKNLKKMQSRMNAMASRRIQTDDDMEKRDLTGKMQKMRKLIDKAEAELQTLKENKEKLLEDARVSGALPGWYRDYED